MARPTVCRARLDSERAAWFGLQPRSAAACRMRVRVAAAMPGRSCTASVTAAVDTPARLATSRIVTRRAPPAASMRPILARQTGNARVGAAGGGPDLRGSGREVPELPGVGVGVPDLQPGPVGGGARRVVEDAAGLRVAQVPVGGRRPLLRAGAVAVPDLQLRAVG